MRAIGVISAVPASGYVCTLALVVRGPSAVSFLRQPQRCVASPSHVLEHSVACSWADSLVSTVITQNTRPEPVIKSSVSAPPVSLVAAESSAVESSVASRAAVSAQIEWLFHLMIRRSQCGSCTLRITSDSELCSLTAIAPNKRTIQPNEDPNVRPLRLRARDSTETPLIDF